MRISSDITTHAGSDELRAHRHSEAYVALVLDGRYSETSADGAWLLEPGDAVVHPPHHFHANSFDGRTSVLNLRIPTAHACAGPFQDYAVLRPRGFDEILRFPDDVEALWKRLDAAERKSEPEPDDWVDAMARDLAKKPSIRIIDLARTYSVSTEHASRRFRQRYRMTPSAFRGEHRFRRALKYLHNEQHSLSEVAQMAGYSDQPHFCRNCVEITGCSPGELRRQFH